MAFSEISICNLALTMLGADSIRTFDENNKRARLCQNMYEASRDFLLAEYDWSFARKITKLQQLDPASYNIAIPEGHYLYALPSDCMTPRDIHPKELHLPWELYGPGIISAVDPMYLYYSTEVTDVAKFTLPFIKALSYAVASGIAHPITQDIKITSLMNKRADENATKSFSEDSNMGSTYMQRDEDPDYDTYVHPEYKVGDLTWRFTE